jgi:DNA ligase-1
MILPTLYKTTKTGAIQTYSIEVKGSSYFVTQGQLEGKKQVYETVCSPKNVGKANETSAEEQAILEAKAKHAKKIKAGYTTSIEKPTEILLPQKVKVFQEQLANITFPCYSAPKLNGVNGTYWLLEDGSLRLTSRGGEEYPPIPHLEVEIRHAMKLLNTTCLNGELYIHGEHLQDITSAVKKPKELSKELTFVVFEIPYGPKTYQERRLLLHKTAHHWFLEDLLGTSKISFLVGIKCNSFEDIEKQYEKHMKSRLEGSVIYLSDAEYQFNTRNSKVLKYKKAQDAEFKIVDYELDKNGHPTLVCETNNKTFKVRPKGTIAEREAILANINDYINSWYKIEYETLSKDGIPLKGIGIGLRNCDSHGNPLE